MEMESKEGTELVDFSREGLKREKDIQAFASIVLEIMSGGPAKHEVSIPTGIPDFVSMMIKSGLSPISRTNVSFNALLEILKWNKFQIEDGVDSAEVSGFVSWVESAEYPDN
jgi:hypothetical protein